MLERINNAFASVRTFTGNASHELRTPISLMRTEIEVALLSPRDAEEYRAILNRLLEETVRMTNLVENLLSLARADGGAENLSLAPFPVERLFSSVAGIWENPMRKAGIQFNVARPEPAVAILCEASSIQRLLSILLENASKYTPSGGSVELRAEAKDSSVVFSVEDTGIGIAPLDLPRIFDRFYRAEQMSESNPTGSGLGLSLAKWIAERHSTELKVESELGKGSIFSFELRRAL
jgi:signal transduction histidine kinase